MAEDHRNEPWRNAEMLRALLENAHEGIWIIDGDAVTTFVNPRMAEMLGYEREEMIGRHLFDFMDERGVAISEAHIERRRRGIREQHDFELLRKDGSRVYTVMETSPITHPERDYDGAVAFVTDITERRRMEEALRTSEETYRAIFDGANDAIAVLDIEAGAIVDVNQAFCRLTGVTVEQAKNRPPAELSEPLPEYSDVRVRELIARAARAGGAPVFVKWRARAAGGGYLTVEASLQKARVAGKDRVLAFARDITQREQVEEQLRVRQRMDSLGTLAAGFAHDFNNLLQSISLNLALLDRSTLLSDRDRQLVVDSLKGCTRAADVVRQLRELSKAAPDERAAIDPFDVASAVLPIALHRDTTVRRVLDFERGAFRVQAATSELHQLLLNLVTNAMQAIADKPGGATPDDEIRISAESQVIEHDSTVPVQPGTYVRLRVSDSGVGMTDAVREQAFDPMFTTRRRSSRGGQGLGLALVYHIAERCGGHARIASAAGEPTVVEVFLPGAAAAATAAAVGD